MRKLYPLCLLSLLYVLIPSANAVAQITTIVKDSVVKKQRVVQSHNIFFDNDTAVRYGIMLRYNYTGNRGSTFRPLDRWPGFGYGYERFTTDWGRTIPVTLPEPFYNTERADVAYDTLHDMQYDDWSPDTITLVKYNVYNDSNQPIVNGVVEDKDAFGERRMTRYADGRINSIIYRRRTYVNGQPHEYNVFAGGVAYNSKGQPIADTIYRFAYKDTLLHTYEYDSAGRIAAITYMTWHTNLGWMNRTREKLSYNTKGDLRQYTLEMPDSNKNWEVNDTWISYYDSGRLSTLDRISDVMGTPYKTTFQYHYNTLGEMDTLTHIAPEFVSRYTFTYNSYHNPDSVWALTYYNGVLSENKMLTVHTYEEYNDTIRTEQQQLTEERKLVLYPNPAGSNVTIRWNKSLPAGAVYVSLYNAVGQLVRRERISKAATENNFSLAGLAPGVYTVQILTASGGKVYTGQLSVVP